MKRLPIAAALILLLGGIGWYALGSSQSVPGVTDFSVQAQEGKTSDADLSLVEEMSLGKEDAPVEVIEYASFTCPHCRAFHDGPMKQLKADYIDTGKVHFIYREVYFDRYGLWAGMVARCGGPLRYFGISDLIYDQQSEWTKGEPAQIAANLRKIGKTAGLSDEQLDACMQDSAKAEAMVATFEKNAKADEVNATPTFIIDGQKYSNMSYEEFSKTLDEKLAD
ncbi:DsbA family protein [Oceaniglobus roseus]|uniref:DsbA family protein n=1 Tax=Oceaniglobus roseus TaxID=1737570 RepID=UPI000C7F682A|nr:DsbA family protein [Kandeliimicrobium roseum]